MRRYPTRDEIIQQEDDRNWTKEVTEEQPMNNHQVNQSGNCVIEGCPCRGWSAQEEAGVVAKEEPRMSDTKRKQFEYEASDVFDYGTRQRARQKLAVLDQSHQPAARGGGDEWRADSDGRFGYVWQGGGLLATCSELSRAQQIVTEHNQHQSLVAEREQMVEALKGVAIMLNTELERYDKEPWAQRVRAALSDQNE